MRLLFLLLAIFLLFSFIHCDEEEIYTIARNLMNRQLDELSLAAKERNYEMVNKLYFIPDIFPRDEAAYEAVIDLFKDCEYKAKIGYFTTKSILDGYLEKVCNTNGQVKTEPYRITMKRNAWSPTDWKIYSMGTKLA
ncbi:unnamed protein product [Caenorhabditis brenneri]